MEQEQLEKIKERLIVALDESKRYMEMDVEYFEANVLGSEDAKLKYAMSQAEFVVIATEYKPSFFQEVQPLFSDMLKGMDAMFDTDDEVIIEEAARLSTEGLRLLYPLQLKLFKEILGEEYDLSWLEDIDAIIDRYTPVIKRNLRMELKKESNSEDDATID